MKPSLYESLRKVVNEDSDMAPAPQEETKPEITDELVEELINTLGAGDINKEEFKKGLQTELEHYDTVEKDMVKVGSIVLDHIKEFPNASYYDALSAMEAELKEVEKPAEEPAPEVPAEELAMEETDEAKKKKKATAKQGGAKPKEVGDADQGKLKTIEGKIPENPAEYSEEQMKTLMEDTLTLIPKGQYDEADATGKVLGKITIDVATEAGEVTEVEGKRLIPIKKAKEEDIQRYIIVEKKTVEVKK